MLNLTGLAGRLVFKTLPSAKKKIKDTQGLLDLLAELAIIETPFGGSFRGIIVSANDPGPAGQGNIWLRTTGDGTPLGVNFYINGGWIEIQIRSIAVWRTGNYNDDRASLEKAGFFLMDGTGGLADLTEGFKGTGPNYTSYAVAFVGPRA